MYVCMYVCMHACGTGWKTQMDRQISGRSQQYACIIHVCTHTHTHIHIHIQEEAEKVQALQAQIDALQSEISTLHADVSNAERALMSEQEKTCSFLAQNEKLRAGLRLVSARNEVVEVEVVRMEAECRDWKER